MPQLFTGSASISTTEYSLTNTAAPTTIAAQATSGIFEVVLGLQNLVAGDAYRLRIYEKVRSTSTQYLVQPHNIVGVQVTPIMIYPSPYLVNGWDFTLTRLAGADRVIEWSIRQVAVT